MRIRAFLALSFSVAVTRRLAEEIARRKSAVGDARVAWVPAANLHLTLKFLGSIPEEAIEAIDLRLRQIAAAHPPFEARARGLGAFPSLEQPSVLWAGVEGGEPLAKLQRAVEAALHEAGFPREERPFHPHVTVGRVKDLLGGFNWGADTDFGVSPFNEIVIYESRTLKTGSEYIARGRVALGADKKETRDGVG